MMRQKSLFNKNLFFEDIKQNKHIMILYTAFLLLITTLPAIISYNNYVMSNNGSVYLLRECAEMLSLANPFVMLLNCGVAVIFVLLQFGYLYKTSSVIFYHSMPITRKNMLITKFLAGFVCMLIPIIIAFLVNSALNVIIGVQYIISMRELLEILCAVILATLFMYSVVTFAQTLCSNVFALVILTAFIFLLYPITKAVAVGTFTAYMPTYNMSLNLPLADYIYPIWIISEKSTVLKHFTPSFALYLVIVPIILITLSAIIYSKRKSENTNKFFAFDVVNKFLKYYITICLSFGVGTIIRENTAEANLVILYIVHIVATVLIFSVLQAIFDKNIKNMFANKKQMAIVALLILLVVTAFEVDVFKIDKMTPDVNKTEKVYVRMPLVSKDGRFYNSSEMVFEDKQNIENAVNLLKLGKPMKNFGWTIDDDIVDIRFATPSYNKIGISRSFYVSGAEYEKFMSRVYDTKEYKAQIYDLTHYSLSERRAIDISVPNEQYGYKRIEYISDKKINEILETLKKEGMEKNYNDIKDDAIVYIFSYETKHINESGGWDYDWREAPIFESFEKTVELIKQVQLEQLEE